MTSPYYDREAVITKPRRSPANLGLSPFIAAIVLIVALICFAESKRRATPKPAQKPAAPKPELAPLDEAAEIAAAKKAYDANQKRRITNQYGRAAWQ